MRLGEQTSNPHCPVQILAVPPTTCLTVSRYQGLSVPQTPHFYKEDKSETLFWGVTDIQQVNVNTALGMVPDTQQRYVRFSYYAW